MDRRLKPLDHSEVRFFLVVRVVAVSSLMLAALLIQWTTDVVLPINYIYYLTGLTYVLTIAWIILGRLMKSRDLHLYLQIFGDALLETVIVYFTGGLDSPFSFLYLISIITASMLLYRRGGVLVASACVILFGGLTDLMFYRVLPYPDVAWLFSGEVWTPTRIYVKLAVNFAGFYAAAMLTSYLSEQLRSASQQLSARSEDLARLRALSENVIASISSGVLTLDREGHITFANHAAGYILDRDPEDLSAITIVEAGFFTPFQWTEIIRDLEISRVAKGEQIVELHEGGLRHLGYAITPLRSSSEHGFGLTLIFQDLSERKRLEEQLRLKDRMAAVGELSAGIAHEIRNPLAAIAGSVQVLRQSSDFPASEKRLMSIIERESERLNRSIADFLRFVKPSEPEPSPFDIAGDLSEAVALLRNSSEITAQHRVELDVDPEEFLIVGDSNQIRQVFWNMARNAVQAMPGGGVLEVSARPAGEVYEIRFRDNGSGMTERLRKQMFDPFRTNRPQGTGIGMAICWRIVQEHGGSIEVQSEPGEGTEVIVRLPLREEEKGATPLQAEVQR